jgi:hypothetical protein
MLVMFHCALNTHRDQQTDRDGKEVQEELAGVADCLMRRVDVKHDGSLSDTEPKLILKRATLGGPVEAWASGGGSRV